jgi:predicted aspartyl protease
MALLGPRIPIEIGIPQAQADGIVAAGGAVPSPVFAYALIDTGANATFIDQKVALDLGLQPTGTESEVGGVAGKAPGIEYVAQITWPGTVPGLYVVTSIDLEHVGVVALIGTEILRECVFVWDGPNGTFSLSW